MKVLIYNGYHISYEMIPGKNLSEFSVMGVIYHSNKLLGQCTTKVYLNNATILIFKSIENEAGKWLYDFMARYVVHLVQKVARKSNGICPMVYISYENKSNETFLLKYDYLCDKWSGTKTPS